MPIMKECPVCKEPIDTRGWERHKNSHKRGGAGKLLKGRRVKRSEDMSAVTTAGKLTTEQVQICDQYFPTNPLLFNALTFLFAAGVVTDVAAKLDALKSSMVYIDLEIQKLGGWDANDDK